MSSDIRFEEEEYSSKFNGRTLARILAQTRPHWKMVAGFMAAIIVVSFLESFFTYLSKRIIDEGIVAQDQSQVINLLVTYGLIMVLQSLAVFTFIFFAGVLGDRVAYDLRKKIFDHLQVLSLSYFDRTPVGWIMSRLTSDTRRMAELVTWGMLDVTWAAMNILTAVIFMLMINWQLTLIVIALLPVLIVIAIWFKQKILVEFREARKANSKMTASYNENITGVRVAKSLHREARNLEEFQELSGDMYRSSYRAAWLSALFLPSVQIISAIAIGLIVWLGGGQIESGLITVGGIQAFVGYITFMMWPVQDLARVYAEMQQAIASAERSFSLLDTPPEVQDRPGAVDPGTLRGEIVFENVDFYYTEDKPVLKNLNLRIKPGETIALVGPTGAGKSTIVNLLCRFYEPKGGRITINGMDYTEMTLHGIHSRIGMVLQTPHLFSGTIRDNLRYGRLDATDEEIEAAAKLAGAHEFIMTIDGGYDAQVGEGGVLLSVGQKQLISLARAVLAQPDIFIMDEATSSVDTLTEALIQRGMEELMRDRTSFIIAHRLSTIKNADRILVVEDGGISEMGTHRELIRQRGHYYELYTKQFRAKLEEQYKRELATQELETLAGD